MSDVDHDVPVEYSILVLARVRDADGFKDISAYEELGSVYNDLTADLSRWREHARYYGIHPPSELKEDDLGCGSAACGDAEHVGNTGQDDA